MHLTWQVGAGHIHYPRYLFQKLLHTALHPHPRNPKNGCTLRSLGTPSQQAQLGP